MNWRQAALVAWAASDSLFLLIEIRVEGHYFWPRELLLAVVFITAIYELLTHARIKYQEDKEQIGA